MLPNPSGFFATLQNDSNSDLRNYAFAQVSIYVALAYDAKLNHNTIIQRCQRLLFTLFVPLSNWNVLHRLITFCLRGGSKERGVCTPLRRPAFLTNFFKY
jgi:hypothetical protein